MSNPPNGASAPQDFPIDDGDATIQVADHLKAALALLDASGRSTQAAAYIQTALDCLEQSPTT